jgi:hypothetical protein
MTEGPSRPAPDSGDLQFDRAETSRPPAGLALCAACKRPLGNDYYLVRSARICAFCRESLNRELVGGSGAGRLLKAAFLGLLAALVGGGLWALFIYTTNIMIGFIAVGLGYLVGIAVRKGAGGRGGRRYQVLALSLVYFGVATAYMGLVIAELGKSKAPAGVVQTAGKPPDPKPGDAKESAAPASVHPGAAGCFGALGKFALLYAGMPVLVGKDDPFTFLFLAFALWEAWKLNAGVTVNVKGPFRLGARPGSENSTNG